jgi:hypothetical protein
MTYHRATYNVHGAWTRPSAWRAASSAPAGRPQPGDALSKALAVIERAHAVTVRTIAQTRRAVMNLAWATKRAEPGRSLADCLRAAWALIRSLGR